MYMHDKKKILHLPSIKSLVVLVVLVVLFRNNFAKRETTTF